MTPDTQHSPCINQSNTPGSVATTLSLGVHIPDTIIVQKGSPAHWFYTDEKSTRVMMKEEELLRDKQYVLSALTQRAGVSQQARGGAGRTGGGWTLTISLGT